MVINTNCNVNKNEINSFKDDYYFLSNYYESPITYRGITYKCAESAFQAQKNPSLAFKFNNLNGSDSNKLGRNIPLRSNWDEVKVPIMTEILLIKFQEPELQKLLLETDEYRLVEGNDCGDFYWGVCKGTGKNKLGELLMKVRNYYLINN